MKELKLSTLEGILLFMGKAHVRMQRSQSIYHLDVLQQEADLFLLRVEILPFRNETKLHFYQGTKEELIVKLAEFDCSPNSEDWKE